MQLRPFDLFLDCADPTGAMPGQSQRRPRSVLRERLFDLIEAAGIMQLSVPERGVKLGLAEQLAAIDLAADGFALEPDLALTNRLWCGLHGLKAAADDRVPPGIGYRTHLPDALLVLPARGANARALYFDRRSPLEVREGIDGRFELAGPYLALVEFARDFAGRLVAIRAYAQAVFSRDWLVPVDSQLERETLQLLIALQDRLDDQGLECSIAKSCRPDGSAPCLEVTVAGRGERIAAVGLCFDGAQAMSAQPEMDVVLIGRDGLELTQLVNLFEVRIAGHSAATSEPKTHT